MINDQRILAVIPARGGSKRLPKKNLIDLAGKPLIAWSIEAALQSKYIDHVVVSTDHEEIAAVSKRYGADVPFMRPNDLATDTASSIDVVLHAIHHTVSIGEQYELLMLLQPTSPLRTVNDIDNALRQLIKRDDDAVISVCEAECPPEWFYEVDDNLSMDGLFVGSNMKLRSQESLKYYRPNGAIYVISIHRLLSLLQNPKNECNY